MEVVITNQNFESEVLNSDIPVMVDFYADWCGPCKMIAPIIKEIAQEYEGKCKIGKCNIDDNMELAKEFRVMSVPTNIIFKNGQTVETIMGAVSKQDFLVRLDKVIGS